MIDLIIGLLVPLAGAVAALFKSIKFVHEGELGIRLRFGKAWRNKDGTPRIIQPGFVLLVPWVDTLQRRHVRQQTIPLAEQRFLLKDGLVFLVSGYVLFRVKDIYKALFEVDDLDHAVKDLCQGVLRVTMSEQDHSGIGNVEALSAKILTALKEKSDEWGIEMLNFQLTNCAPVPEVTALMSMKPKLAMLEEAAKTMGTELKDMPGHVASVLIGSPLVASPEVNTQVVVRQATS